MVGFIRRFDEEVENEEEAEVMKEQPLRIDIPTPPIVRLGRHGKKRENPS